MKNSKLLKLLKRLDRKELKRLQSFIQSPFFNKNQHIIDLYCYLMEQQPAFQSDKIEKKTAYDFVFKNKKFNNTVFNNLTSDLLQLVYDFLAIQYYQSNHLAKQNNLIKDLVKRNAKEQIQTCVSKFEKIQAKNTKRNHEYYLHQHQLYDNLDQYYLQISKRHYDQNLQHKNDQLDLYYLHNKLMMTCEMASRNIVMTADYDFQSFSKQIEFFKEKFNFEDFPAMNIYYKVLQMLLQEATSYFYELKALIIEQRAVLSDEEFLHLNGYLLNFCVKKINSGKQDYYKEFFNIYQILLQEQSFLDNLTTRSFTNIVTASLRLEKFEWASEFIESFAVALQSNDQENTKAYNLASLYHAIGQHKKALLTLHTVEFTDTFYHLGAKIIQLKSYYTLNEEEAFLSLIEAFRKFIKRTKGISPYHQKANSNLIKFAKKIFQLRNKKEFLKLQAFLKQKKELQETIHLDAPIANKEWLIGILEAL